MARTINFRVKAGPGALQRAVIDDTALPQSITGLVNGTTYEVDTGKGVWVDVTPAAGPTFSMVVEDLKVGTGIAPNASATFDFSALAAGDKVVVIAGYGDGGGVAPTCTVQGVTATRLASTNPIQSGDRNIGVWEATLTSPGSAAAVVAFVFGTSAAPRIAVFGFKGAGTVSQAIGSYFSETTFSRSVTPSGATNILVALSYRSNTPTAFAWTGATQLRDIDTPITDAAATASVSNVPASTYAVGFTKTDTLRGALAVVCINPA